MEALQCSAVTAKAKYPRLRGPRERGSRGGGIMCGIIGYVGGTLPEGHWGQSHEMIGRLLVAAQTRGKDATGIAAAMSPYDHAHRVQQYVSKMPGAASDF